MVSSLQVGWEAEYFTGATIRERDGVRYQDLDRDQLKTFRIVAPGEVVVEFHVKPGQNGHGLAYRRRTTMGSGGRKTWFIVGMIPSGPVVAFQPETNEVLKADRFESGAGPLGKMIPLPFERWTNTAHGVDAVVRASRVVLPSGYVLNV